MEIYKFLRALLFGSKTYEIHSSNCVLVNQLVADIHKVINIKETMELGGLLHKQKIIENDLQNIIKYIERGNEHFIDKCHTKNNSPVALKTSLIRNFYYNLSRVCRGNLEEGVLSNLYVRDTIPQPEKKDEETLENILTNENDVYLVFQNAEFWGTIAKKLLQKEKFYVPSIIKSPVKFLRDIQQMFDIKCQSLGKIINPYSLKLVFYDYYVDPIHWQSVKSLEQFLKYFPDNNLSQTCRKLINLIITSIINADDTLLPKGILDDEIQLRTFIKNIENVHHRIEKVVSSNVPLKVIDVFHRLLALLRYDYMWEEVHLKREISEEPNSILINIYLKNVQLERENKLLHKKLNEVEKKNVSCQFCHQNLIKNEHAQC